VNLSWDEPQGYTGELSYVIEESEDEYHEEWTEVTTTTKTTHTTQNLERHLSYRYRICSKNSYGRSSWIESDEITFRAACKLLFLISIPFWFSLSKIFFLNLAVPSPPTAPLETRQITLNTVVVEWGIPESDGGEPLEDYVIMLKKKNLWIEIGRTDATKFVVKDLEVSAASPAAIFSTGILSWWKDI